MKASAWRRPPRLRPRWSPTKGYHAREVLKRPADGRWRTRIAEPTRRTVLRWQGDDDARRAVYANRARLLSGVARVALLLRAVLCERAFAHLLDRGGMRRTWLRGGTMSPSATGSRSPATICAC